MGTKVDRPDPFGRIGPVCNPRLREASGPKRSGVREDWISGKQQRALVANYLAGPEVGKQLSVLDHQGNGGDYLLQSRRMHPAKLLYKPGGVHAPNL